MVGNSKREYITKMADFLIDRGFEEIAIPIIQMQSTFKDKVGDENNNMMFNFKGRGNRDLCLAPEYTAVVQQLAKTVYKSQKDVKLFYVQECFRGERPQAGRYRQFTQFGVEIANPTKDYTKTLIDLSVGLIKIFGIIDYDINKDVTRGLDYYEGGKGFEIIYEKLGSSKQICGGGQYDGGAGFAIGVDRLLSAPDFKNYAQFNQKAKEEPYLITKSTVYEKSYNKNYGDDRICKCGHSYYRHFDSYEFMDAIGCKYCNCDTFEAAEKIKAVIDGKETVIGYRLEGDRFTLAKGIDFLTFSPKINQFILEKFNINEIDFFELNKNVNVKIRQMAMKEFEKL